MLLTASACALNHSEPESRLMIHYCASGLVGADGRVVTQEEFASEELTTLAQVCIFHWC